MRRMGMPNVSGRDVVPVALGTAGRCILTHTNPQAIEEGISVIMTDDQRREEAQAYVRRLRAFYIHASVFAGSMVIIVVVNVATNLAAGIAGEWWAWWSIWVLVGWGLGLAIHGLVVRMSRPGGLYGPQWEEQQVDKLLSSEEHEPPR